MTAIPRTRWFQIIFVVVWIILIAAWTKALLMPIPTAAVKSVGGSGPAFWLGKSVHVGVYATFTLLTIVLPFPRRWRVGLIAALVLHAGATEYLQKFVERGNSWRDVGLDSLGCLIGIGLGWRWLRRRGHPWRIPPQVEPQDHAPDKHPDANGLG